MCLIAKYSIDRHKPRRNPGHDKGEKQRDKNKEKKKKDLAMSQLLPSQER